MVKGKHAEDKETRLTGQKKRTLYLYLLLENTEKLHVTNYIQKPKLWRNEKKKCIPVLRMSA